MMGKGLFKVPQASCEKVQSFALGSPERELVAIEYEKMMSSVVYIPMYIGSEDDS